MAAATWSPPPASEWRALGRPVEIRTYHAGSQAKAAEQLAAEAQQAYAARYTISSQSWAPGGRTSAASLFVGLGALFLIGGLFFFPLWALALVCLVIGLVSGKGQGALTVTFTRN